jgi:hypothetical protein|tara:strand:+ start:1994 stop:2806 length:813 start_codon:yes stop_codon:yes gene_type:complete
MTDQISPLKIDVVLPEVIELELPRELHPNLPKPSGLFFLIIGQVLAGKSNFISSAILSDSWYNDLFKEVIVISNTIEHTSTARFLYQKYKKTCHTMYSDSIIENFCKRQEDKMELGEDSSFCLVADDILGEVSDRGRKNARLNYFLTRFRHYSRPEHANCIFLASQKYLGVPSIARNQANVIMISSRIATNREIKAIEEDYSGLVGGNANFRSMLDYCRQFPYSWLVIRLDRGSGAEAWYNFEEKLYPSGGENGEKEKEIQPYEEEGEEN